jgi:hypothetical protein
LGFETVWFHVTRITRSPCALEHRSGDRVVLLGDRIVVPFPAVRLDDKALFKPPEVGREAEPDRLVDVGRREAALGDEVEDGVLEFASDGDVAVGEDPSERSALCCGQLLERCPLSAIAWRTALRSGFYGSGPSASAPRGPGVNTAVKEVELPAPLSPHHAVTRQPARA